MWWWQDAADPRRGPPPSEEDPGAESRRVGAQAYLNLSVRFLLVAPWYGQGLGVTAFTQKV